MSIYFLAASESAGEGASAIIYLIIVPNSYVFQVRVSDYHEHDDAYSPDEPDLPLPLAAARLEISERTLRRRLRLTPSAILGYQRNARGKQTPLVAIDALGINKAACRHRPAIAISSASVAQMAAILSLRSSWSWPARRPT